MQDDFQDLCNHPKLLIKPMIWGTVYTVFDVAMFAVAFLSLGVFVNPAISDGWIRRGGIGSDCRVYAWRDGRFMKPL